MAGIDWICPYCHRHQVVTDDNTHVIENTIYIGYKQEKINNVTTVATRCLNSDCNQMSLRVLLFRAEYITGGTYGPAGEALAIWDLMPDGIAKPQPEYIPAAIRQDYEEACKILDKSPKASATLARRCLQGMIRDFCKISKNRLFDEIGELRKQINDGTAPREVSPESVDAIDNVREVGNIGAHMEKDVNLIIDIDHGEARLLVELIETLFEEWYISRHKRQERFSGIKTLAAEKKAAKKVPAPAATPALPKPNP